MKLRKKDKTTPFWELYGLNPDDYGFISIRDLHFHRVSVHQLESFRIFNLQKLLYLTPKQLLQISYIGEVSYKNLLAFLNELKNGNVDITAYKISYANKVPLDFALNRYNIAQGDFSKINKTRKKEKLIEQYIRSQQIVGTEFATTVLDSADKILPIISALSEFNKKHNLYKNRLTALNGLLNSISKSRASKNIYDYINLYSPNVQIENVLRSIFIAGVCRLTNEQKEIIITDSDKYTVLVDFFRWFRLSPEFYIRTYMNQIFNSAFKRKLIDMKADGYSFSEIKMAIPNRSINGLITAHNHLIESYFAKDLTQIFYMLSLDLNKKTEITESDLIKEFGTLAPRIKYLYSLSMYEQLYFDATKKLLILK